MAKILFDRCRRFQLRNNRESCTRTVYTSTCFDANKVMKRCVVGVMAPSSRAIVLIDRSHLPFCFLASLSRTRTYRYSTAGVASSVEVELFVVRWFCVLLSCGVWWRWWLVVQARRSTCLRVKGFSIFCLQVERLGSLALLVFI